MVALTGQYQQIISDVVGGVAITVMHDLAGLQQTPEIRDRELTMVRQLAPSLPVPEPQVLSPNPQLPFAPPLPRC